MRRVQLFEFEDFDWFPTSFRTAMTNLINVLHRMVGTADVLAGLLKDVHARQPFSQIVDLGSGSGGAMPGALEKLNEGREDAVSLKLTDLHPNPAFIKEVGTGKYPNVTYHTESVDATNLGGGIY